jgi:hypothetical protein
VVLTGLAGLVVLTAVALSSQANALSVLSRHGVGAQATLTQCTEHDESRIRNDGESESFPVWSCTARFQVPGGELVTTPLAFDLNTRPDLTRYVRVLYDPHHPKMAAVDNDNVSLFAWLVTQAAFLVAFLVIGVITILGAVLLLVGRQAQRRGQGD